jgi:hypothetical protein
MKWDDYAKMIRSMTGKANSKNLIANKSQTKLDDTLQINEEAPAVDFKTHDRLLQREPDRDEPKGGYIQ